MFVLLCRLAHPVACLYLTHHSAQLWNFIDNTAFETQLDAEINPNEIDSDLELEAELNALDIEN